MTTETQTPVLETEVSETTVKTGDVLNPKPRRKARKKAAKRRQDENKITSGLAKIANFHSICDQKMFERGTETRLLTTGLISGCSVFLVGAPGTGKSALCDALCQFIDSGKVFRKLMTKHTEPSELFGPMSMASFKAEKFRRVTTGYLPEARVAFLDEIWKASSAVLNNLLQILNEGTFQNGDVEMDVPLQLFIGASNEYPPLGSSSNLHAMYDRFLIRKEVQEVRSSRAINHILFNDVEIHIEPKDRLTDEELSELRQAAQGLQWEKTAKDQMKQAILECQKKSILPSGRRIRKATAACAAQALMAGKSSVTANDLGSLEHILWVDPEHQVECANIVGDLCDPSEKQKVEIQKKLDSAVAHLESNFHSVAVDGVKTINIPELCNFQNVCNDLASQARGNGLTDLADHISKTHQEIHDRAMNEVGKGV